MRQQLIDLTGASEITWHAPINRGTAASSGPVRQVTSDQQRQVMIWWKATPTPPSLDETDLEMSFGENPD